MTNRTVFKQGRLTARLQQVHAHYNESTKGLQSLGLDTAKDALLYVPKNYTADLPAPLAVMLHGAGGNADHGLSLIHEFADKANIILLAPVSRRVTWDIISSHYFGPDVLFINQALEAVFNRFNIDAAHIAIGGFSDGASYALSLGLLNGNLFTHVLAFSPGFCYAPEPQGKPGLFFSHGTEDDVLPIDPCSRRLVPVL